MVSCDSLLAIQSSKQCSNSVLSCSRSSADEWESLWRGESMSEGVRVDGEEGRVDSEEGRVDSEEGRVEVREEKR